MPLRRIAASTIALALVGTLAACGSDDMSSASTHQVESSSDSSAKGALNAADIEFAQGMIVHHQQAIKMADIALDPKVGASSKVVDLATRIKGEQNPEVELMTGWLTAAGQPVKMDASTGGHMGSMEGMMTPEQMDAMAAKTGADFDQLWLRMMIAHHEGAVSQSQAVKANGSNADVLALADAIIQAQQAEIKEMQALLGA